MVDSGAMSRRAFLLAAALVAVALAATIVLIAFPGWLTDFLLIWGGLAGGALVLQRSGSG